MAQNVNYSRLLQTDLPLDNNIPKVRAVAPALASQQLLDRVFPSINLSNGRDPALSGNSINHGFTVADWTWFQRTVSDLAGTIQPYNHSSNLDPIFNTLTTPGASVVYQAFGTPSTAYAWTAPLQMVEDYHNMNHAKKIGDTEGANYAKATFVQDATLAAGGTAFAGYRSTAIASSVKRVAPSGFYAPTALGRVTYCFVFIGIVFFTLYYLILSAVLGVKMYQGEKFKNALEKSGEGLQNPAAAVAKFEFLKEKLCGVPENLFEDEKNNEISLDERNSKLMEVGLSHAVKEVEKLLESVGETRSEAQIRAFLTSNIPNKLYFVERGRDIKLKKLEAKREVELARLTSKECVALIKTAKTPEEKQIILDKVEKALKNNRNIYAKVITACMMGAIFMAAGLLCASGIGAIIIAVAMVIVALAMIKLDSDGLQDSLTNEAPRKLDKTLVKISMALCVASLAVVVGLITAGLIAASPYVIVMSLVLSLIWLVYNMKTLRTINEKEKRFNEENPTVEAYLEGLKGNMSTKELEQIFRKLPIEAQKIVEENSGLSTPEEVAKSTMKKILQLQQERQNQLRLELSVIR